MRRTVLQVGLAALALSVIAIPAAYAEDETGFSLRLNGTWTIPNGETIDRSHPDAQVEVNTGETFGLALSGEYRFSERLGVEVGVQAGYEVDVNYTLRATPSGEIIGDDLDPHPGDHMRFTLIDAALNIYLTSGGGVDFYVGPVLGFISYTDTAVRLGSEEPLINISNDGDFAFGAVVGLDIPFIDSPWFVTSSIKYLVSSYDAEIKNQVAVPFANAGGATEVDFDPWIFRFGLGYKF